MITIRNHRLAGPGTRYVPAKHQGGRIEATAILLHDTAGNLRPFSSVEWFQNPDREVSAHVVIERDGTITQMVDFDRKAYHAGDSEWGGIKYCNGRMIGVEIVNPGLLSPPSVAGVCQPESFHASFRVAEFGIREATSVACGHGWWMPYSSEQLSALDRLNRALVAAYPAIVEILGHHDVAPRRKIDPNPLLPWDVMRAALGTRRPLDTEAVAELQDRLSALGYHLGTADGHWGPRSRSALRDFQEQNDLPITGSADEATVAVLMRADARPMVTGSRDEWTAADLARQGSTQVATGATAKRVGTAIITAGMAMAGSDATAPDAPSPSAGLPHAVPSIDTVDSALTLAERLLHLVPKLAASPVLWLALALAAGGAAAWWAGHRTIARRLDAARTGRHIGV